MPCGDTPWRDSSTASAHACPPPHRAHACPPPHHAHACPPPHCAHASVRPHCAHASVRPHGRASDMGALTTACLSLGRCRPFPRAGMLMTYKALRCTATDRTPDLAAIAPRCGSEVVRSSVSRCAAHCWSASASRLHSTRRCLTETQVTVALSEGRAEVAARSSE